MTATGLPRSARDDRMDRVMAVLTAAGIRFQHMGAWYLILTLEDAEKIAAAQARWAQLRKYLDAREGECQATADLLSGGTPGRVRFGSEALGYRKALEKMDELGAGQ